MVTATPNVIKDPAFADRLNKACDAHPNGPPLHHGRLTWTVSEFKRKFNAKISAETARKWFSGEARPRPEKMRMLSEVFGVDEAWLSLGIDAIMQPKERRVRNAQADGAVNVVAGMIQLHGGHPAFPADGDPRATKDHVDLYAIIKGVNYAMHVALARSTGSKHDFSIPTPARDVLFIGLIERDAFAFDIIEIGSDLVEAGAHRGGSVRVTVADDEVEAIRIKSFRDRL